MSKVFICATKNHLEPVITEMYRSNLVHIEDFNEQREGELADIRIGNPLKDAEECSVNLVKTRSIISSFGFSENGNEEGEKVRDSEITHWIETSLPAIIGDVEVLVSEKNRLESLQKEIEQKILSLVPYTDLPCPMEILRGYDFISVLAGFVQEPVKISIPHEKFETVTDSGIFLVIAVRTPDREPVERELLRHQFQKITIPEENGYASGIISGYEGEIAGIQKKIGSIEQELKRIRKEHNRFLITSEEYLQSHVEQAEAPLRFATTDLTFSVTGWIPSGSVRDLFLRLDQVTNGKIYTSEMEINDYNNDPPVEYDNPRFAHPTELFLDLMARPKYSEIDPTVIMAVVYPLMFGLILGDVGYGLILLLLSLGLRRMVKKNESGMQLLKTLQTCSISTIAFGIFFSEFLGFSLPWDPIGYSRHLPIGIKQEIGSVHHSSSIPELLVISIWIGILHISLGWMYGIRNAAVMEHGSHRSLKIHANIGWLSLLWGMLLMIWSWFAIPLMPNLTGFVSIIPGMPVSAIIGVIMVLWGLTCITRDDPLELIEVLTKTVSHVLSYTRLIAVGLSSVAIAMVINYIAIDLIIKPQLVSITITGIILIIAGIVLFLLGHTVNTILGILGGGLHPLRLHYVEFFTKFYRGGGKKYTPFGMDRNYTKED